jgi:4-amino-4-deoxy-L-arabinose transferase-like glycosyltransferase
MTMSTVRRLLLHVVLLTLGATAILYIVFPAPDVRVSIQWKASVDDEAMGPLERDLGLTEGRELNGAIWRYALVDLSPANIRAIVNNPNIESTANLDRVRLQPEGLLPASRGVQALQRGAIAGVLISLVLLLTNRRDMPPWQKDITLVLILLAALGLRLYLATTQRYIHDEINTSIPLSEAISFDPDNLHLPLRGENHPAVPAYVAKASSTMFGITAPGYRLAHVLLSLLTIVLVYLMVRDWFGVVAARWAAALLAFNEYYLNVSSRVTAHVPYLLLVTAAIYAFSRFLATRRPRYMYLAGLSVGLAFYCKEHSALLLPVFFLALLYRDHRRWLATPHPYLAAIVFALVISPDLYWNLQTRSEQTETTYGNRTVTQANYSSHLRRFGGIGLSPYPLMFYARSAVQTVAEATAGAEYRDETPEYRSSNPALGLLLIGCVLLTTVGRAPRDDFRRVLLIQFWFVFTFFTLIAPGAAPGRLDPVSWIWVESTILAATMLTGARLAGARGIWRIAISGFAGATLVYAVIAVIASAG